MSALATEDMSAVETGPMAAAESPAQDDARFTSSGRRGRLIGSLGYILAVFWPRDRSQRRENGWGKPGDRFSGPGDHSGPISGHFRRFRARPPIRDLNIVILPQLNF